MSSPLPAPVEPTARREVRVRQLSGLAFAVFVLHAAVLQGLAAPTPPPKPMSAPADAAPAGRPRAVVVQLRTPPLQATPSAPAGAGPAAVSPTPALPALPAPRALPALSGPWAVKATPAPRAGPGSNRHRDVPVSIGTPTPAWRSANPVAPIGGAEVVVSVGATVDPAGTADTDRAHEAVASDGEPTPVYPVRLPPTTSLRFHVTQTGRLTSSSPAGDGGPKSPASEYQAELRWQNLGGEYSLWFGRSAAGASASASASASAGAEHAHRTAVGAGNPGAAASISTGRLDAHGLAPERQVDVRRGRELRAVNFDRTSARITYSGPQAVHPLWPGSQDRLSWLVQLAGVVAADPALGATGRSVQMWVAGPRGDTSVWNFTSAGIAATELPDGSSVPAVHLQRRAESPYDTQADVWLDPARHHLPVRLRLQVRAGAQASDFVLADRLPP